MTRPVKNHARNRAASERWNGAEGCSKDIWHSVRRSAKMPGRRGECKTMRPAVRRPALAAVFARLEILARSSEGRKRVLELVRQQGHAEEIFPRRRLAPLARRVDRALPVLRIEVAPSDPCQRDERCGLVDVEILDELDEFAAYGGVGAGQDGSLPVVGRV